MVTLAIVAPLTRVIVGERYDLAAFPLHVTIVPPFKAHSLERVAEVLAATANVTQPFAVIGERHAWFGPAQDIPVTIASSTALRALHEQALKDLKPLGWDPEVPEYSGTGFVPHATQTGTSALGVGMKMTVTHLALVEVSDPVVVISVDQLAARR